MLNALNDLLNGGARKSAPRRLKYDDIARMANRLGYGLVKHTYNRRSSYTLYEIANFANSKDLADLRRVHLELAAIEGNSHVA
jgi:hypothetical protein